MERLLYNYDQIKNNKYQLSICYERKGDLILEPNEHELILPDKFTLIDNYLLKEDYKIIDEYGNHIIDFRKLDGSDVLYGFMYYLPDEESIEKIMVLCQHNGFYNSISFEFFSNPMEYFIQELIITNNLFKL